MKTLHPLHCCSSPLSAAAIFFVFLFLLLRIYPAYGGIRAAKATHPAFSRHRHSDIKRARESAEALNTIWLSSSSKSVTWKGINAWQRFVIADALTKYTLLTGDRSYVSEIERVVNNYEGLDGNDDDLWAIIASLNVYQLDRSPRFLQAAQSNFKRISESYWDTICGGGIWWDHERTYKNAITNELFLYASTSLYRITNDPYYRTWSSREWKWFSESGLINDQGLINDGLDKNCVNNGQNTYTYNQGVMLSGLVDLYVLDGDDSHIALALKIATASISSLSTPNDILREPIQELNQDSEAFKGIFLYHLGHLVAILKNPREHRVISDFIHKNANHVWTHRKFPGNEINGYWDNSHVLYGAAAQASGLSLFNAVIEISQ